MLSANKIIGGHVPRARPVSAPMYTGVQVYNLNFIRGVRAAAMLWLLRCERLAIYVIRVSHVVHYVFITTRCVRIY